MGSLRGGFLPPGGGLVQQTLRLAYCEAGFAMLPEHPCRIFSQWVTRNLI
jgi:hypothetical protein